MRRIDEFWIEFNSVTEEETPKTSPALSFIYDITDSVKGAIVVVFLLFSFVFRAVGVDGDSMVPTLADGDWLAVRAINTKIERGDIVVITQPNSLNEPLIKRVIAFGGDEVNIDIVAGKVTVNGEVLNEPYIYEPTNRMSNVAFPITVPEGCVFVMGDNRNNSLDSRSKTVGFIDTRYILGVAEFRFYPFGEWSLENYE